ncbi:MAG TPA: hypothetical protein VFF13_00040 [archaeon]|nr:hypothetical protein [archaeon]
MSKNEASQEYVARSKKIMRSDDELIGDWKKAEYALKEETFWSKHRPRGTLQEKKDMKDKLNVQKTETKASQWSEIIPITSPGGAFVDTKKHKTLKEDIAENQRRHDQIRKNNLSSAR